MGLRNKGRGRNLERWEYGLGQTLEQKRHWFEYCRQAAIDMGLLSEEEAAEITFEGPARIVPMSRLDKHRIKSAKKTVKSQQD